MLIMFQFIYEELVSKTSYIPRHVTHLHYGLPFTIKIVRLKKYVPIVGYLHLTYCKMFTK